MPPARKADVIVVVDPDSPDVPSCLQCVLKFSGPVLGRLVVIDDGSQAPELVERWNNKESRSAGFDPPSARSLGPGRRVQLGTEPSPG